MIQDQTDLCCPIHQWCFLFDNPNNPHFLLNTTQIIFFFQKSGFASFYKISWYSLITGELRTPRGLNPDLDSKDKFTAFFLLLLFIRKYEFLYWNGIFSYKSKNFFIHFFIHSFININLERFI